MAGKTFFLALVAVLAVACGGASESPPQPLKTRFDDMYIAQVPLEQKQAMIQTQNDYAVAKLAHAKAQADLSEANTAVEISKNERKSADNTVSSALTNKKQADGTGDQNRINDAARQLRGAELAKKAADRRVSYLEAYRNYLKRLVLYTEESMYWREAQFEVAKAQIAQQNNISPKDFKFDVYPAQEADRQKRQQRAKDRAEDEKQKAQGAREAWLKQQAEADEANGRTSELADPLANASSGGTSSQ